ncbi:uncharacterized protein J7T54_003038 [Emericellopsis cladophorae]|uniref:Xylanolytic transcriptional activator regulatory domain-containing protein n=1 Tax=Emericellopsis cladophorae TaxID=2686198 RepID=A0A9Q0BDK0_9HYPO|nr:uncharacterized protein J7T54_003038 [Emericellopsis cladophorae]KAI6780259.1 hypothetical protein J7T54_003038 [Emericellopsis cladophorae]
MTAAAILHAQSPVLPAANKHALNAEHAKSVATAASMAVPTARDWGTTAPSEHPRVPRRRLHLSFSTSDRASLTPAKAVVAPRILSDKCWQHEPHAPGFIAIFTRISGFISHEQAAVALRRFFESLHCLPGLAFLHKPSLMSRFSKRKLEPPLLAAIVALSSRLPGASIGEKETGFQCADMAEGLVLRSPGQPTFVDTQALLLLLKFRHWTGASNMVFLSMAQLTRIAFALRLNYEKSKLSFFVQESRRRLMWGIYMLDVILADGQEEFTTCPITTIHLRLPSMEDNFELDVENASEQIETQDRLPTSLGIIAYYLRVTHLYDGIIRYLKKASSPKMATDAQWSELQRLEKELNAFMAHLPPNERYSQKNLELRAYSPRLSRYVMTHVWWHHCYSILFRELALNPRDHGTIRIRELIGEMGIEGCRTKCLAHAQSIADIFSSLHDLGGDACILDMEMAHCALSSAEILMQSASSTVSQVAISRDETLHKVSTCLRLAEGLWPMFPAISEMVAELTSAVEAFSLGQSTSPELVPMSCTAMRPHATKHSALYRTNFQDDSYNLEMADPSSEADGQTADRNHLDNAQCSSGSGPEGQAAASHMATQTAGINASMTHAPYATDAQGNSPWAGSGSEIWDQMSLFQGGFNGLELSTDGSALLDIMPSGEGLHSAYNSWGREHMG